MAILVISTQILENYAAHQGFTGEYSWKNKGGHEYKVLDIDVNRAKEIFESVVSKCTNDDDYFQEFVIDWFVESDDYMSWFEKSQFEYEGMITHPEPTINWKI